MKITWNTLHNWRKTSQLWGQIDNLTPEQKQRRMRYVCRDRGGEPCRMETAWQNVLWAALDREFRARFGEEFKFYETVKLGGRVSVYIHQWVQPTAGEWDIRITVHGLEPDDCGFGEVYRLRPPGNMEYTPGNIRAFALKWVNAHLLHGGGMFRAVQLREGLSKARLREWYRNRILPGEPYREEVVAKAIRRRFRVDISGVPFWEGVSWVNKHGRQEKEVYLCHFDTGWLLDIDGDIDEVERGYWEEVEQYPRNAVFV